MRSIFEIDCKTRFRGVVLLFTLAMSLTARGGVIIGGTRFIYSDKRDGVAVMVRNTSQTAYLVNTKILSGGNWQGSKTPLSGQTDFMATPPLFLLRGGKENTLRIIRTGGRLPEDRETLYTLSIAAIPSESGSVKPDSVQMAVRSSMKLLYRPSGLKGSPEKAYSALRWTWSDMKVMVQNPTPYYVTLFQPIVNGKHIDNAGIIAPFSVRTMNWCQGQVSCNIQWQTINDYGRVMPQISRRVRENRS